jgi:hypothetical protein
MAFAAIDYRLAEEKEHRELAVCTDPKTGEPYSRFYRIPETAAHFRIPPSFQRFHPVMPSLQRTGSDSFGQEVTAERKPGANRLLNRYDHPNQKKKVSSQSKCDFHNPCGSPVDSPVEIQGGSYRGRPSVRLPNFWAPHQGADSVR